MMTKLLFCGLAAAVVTACASPAMAAGSDAFNRHSLGATWVVPTGHLAVTGHALTGGAQSIGYLKASSKDTAASAVVSLPSTDIEYGAVAIGNVAAGTNAFVKIQSQDGATTFDHAAFYTGNNSGTASGTTFFALSSAVPSPAVIDVFFCGTVATLRITSAAGVQTYTNDYGTSFGAGAGLGTYGSVSLDNFVGFKTGCADVPAGVNVRTLARDVDKSRPQ